MNVLITMLYDLGHDLEIQREILRLCTASFERNLQGMDQLIVLRGTARGGQGTDKQVRNYRYSKMLVDVFRKTRVLWGQGHDILLADGDTLCIKRTPWPGGNRLRLFNLACARVPGDEYPRDAYLHSGIKLLPQAMDSALWEIGQQMFDAYDRSAWAYDQLIWNRMHWAQDGLELARAREYVDPRYCWMPLREFDNLGVPREEAYIVHYHETRGMRRCLERMRRDAR